MDKHNRTINISGKKFGRITVLSFSHMYISPKGKRSPFWNCQCTCGVLKKIKGNSLKTKKTISCGCFNRENAKKLGLISGGKKRLSITGEKNYKWKGENASYFAKHIWLNSHYKKPKICSFCKSDKYRIEWANISGKYVRNISDYIAICRSCHFHFDRISQNEKLLKIKKNTGIVA
jgi:hypothetical protein